jgi:hypothetical protein
MNYQIAIPTRRRPDAIRKYTLKYLESTNVPRESITLFVSDSEDAKNYESVNQGYNIVIAKDAKSLGQKRRFISQHYAEGTPVISFDDDVSRVEKLVMDEPLKGVTKPLDHKCHLETILNLDEFIQEGFELAKEKKVKLWGCYPVANKGFLHPKITLGLKFIMGHFFGFYAGDPIAGWNADPKDDIYTTLWHFTEYGNTLRYDNMCVRSKAHSGSGGSCEDLEAKLTLNNDTVQRICSDFPELATVKYRNSKDEWLARYHEVRLKTITNEVIPV